MSIKVMSYVWEHAPYKEGTLLVLLALANWADDDGLCWPKIDQLAVKSRQSRRNVFYTLKRLEHDNVISYMPGRGRTYQNAYHINIDILKSLHPPGISEDKKGAKGAVIAPLKQKVQKVQKVQVATLKGASSVTDYIGRARGTVREPLLKERPLFISPDEITMTHNELSMTHTPTHEEIPPPSPQGETRTRSRKFPPTGFQITDAMREWASHAVPGVHLERETAAFCDYEFRSVRTDWVATWRNWMRNVWKRLPAVERVASTPFTKSRPVT